MKTLPCAVIALLLAVPGGLQASAEEISSKESGIDKIETTAGTDSKKSRRVHFVDEDGDGINDVVQQRALFLGGEHRDGEYQENQGLFMYGERSADGPDGANGRKFTGKGFRK